MVVAQVGNANAYRTLLGELAVWLRRYYVKRLPPAVTDGAVKVNTHRGLKRLAYVPLAAMRSSS